MAEDLTKQILVDIKLRTETIKQDLVELNKELDVNKKKLIEVEKESGRASTEYEETASEVRKVKKEIREHNKELDNSYKAIRAQNGSIAQNRALLSAMTAEYIKLGDATGQAAVKKQEFAKSIRELSDRLKEQEKEIGQNYRNVGNYKEAINEALSELSGGIPGVQYFGAAVSAATKIVGFLPSAMTDARKGVSNFVAEVKNGGQQISNFVGFKQFGSQATEAAKATEQVAEGLEDVTEAGEDVEKTAVAAAGGLEAVATAGGHAATAEAAVAVEGEAAAGGLAAMGTGATLAAGAIGLVIAAVAGLISYLNTLDGVGDKIEQVWEGMKATGVSAIESIRAGRWGSLVSDMSKADLAARELTGSFQDLDDNIAKLSVTQAENDERISQLMLKMRNRNLTAADEKKYYSEIQALAKQNYNEMKYIADQNYELTIKQITNARYQVTAKDLKLLREQGVHYAIQLQSENKIAAGAIEKVAEAQRKQISAQQYYDSIMERAQNRNDALFQKWQAEQEKKEKAELDTEAMRQASLSRQLQATFEAYGAEAIAADQQYNAELLKLNSFLNQKLISQKTYDRVILQLRTEHEAQIQKIIDKFADQDAANFVKAQNELIALRNAAIQNDAKQQEANLKQSGKEKIAELDRQNKEILETVDKLNTEIGILDGAAKAEAEERRLNELALYQINGQKKAEIEEKTARDIAKIRRDAANKAIKDTDSAAVADANRPGNEGGLFEARKKQLEDNRTIELSNERLTAAEKLRINAEYNQQLFELESNERTRRFEQYAQYENIVQDFAFNMLNQRLQASTERRLKQLETDKAQELENTNLTGTQRKAIEQKYEKLQDQERRKQFKKNQTLQVANTLINGFVAAGKTIAENGLPFALPYLPYIYAQTGASIAGILAQKPGFDKGGTFTSDGKGAILPGYSKHDNTNAYLRSGEAVIVSEAARDPQTRSLLSAINVAYGGRAFAGGAGYFTKGQGAAIGGIYTDGGNANRYYAQPVVDQQGLANSLAYQLINNFPPLFVNVRDINAQQSILAKTVDRVNL